MVKKITLSLHEIWQNWHPPMHCYWLIGAILGAATIAGSIIKNRHDRKAARKEREYAAQQSELAYQRQNEQIEKQNLYNAPDKQLERYRDAGLNPNLIYGSGAQSGGNQQQTASYQPSQRTAFSPLAIPDMLSMYQNFEMKQAQINQTKAATENTHQKTMTEAIRQYVMKLQGKTGEFDLDRRKYLAPYEAAITGNQARASEARLAQEWKKLQLMSHDEKLKVLQQARGEKTLTAIDLDNEKRQADIIYKKYENQWRAMGITNSDNILLRIFARMIQDSGFQGNIEKLFK